MCGIVAATASREVLDVVIDGLRVLEYRGYDSAGVAVVGKKRMHIRKKQGKILELEKHLSDSPINGSCAIGHTRWATHGEPSHNNAHPHVSHGCIAVVHNGIIENADNLRAVLRENGYQFDSDTDSEVIPHMIHRFQTLGDGFSEACRRTIGLLEGAYALAITNIHEPGKIIAARKASPLIIGVGCDGYFLASDKLALLRNTQDFILLEDGDIAEILPGTCKIFDSTGSEVKRALVHSEETVETITKGGFSHFMQKEIFEQPNTIRATLDIKPLNSAGKHMAMDVVDLECAALLMQADHVQIVACGSSLNAGLIARYWIESIAGVPCSVEIASEYRYRRAIVPANSLFICISQSGETADTLAALRHAKSLGYLGSLGICNVKGSAIDRECTKTLLTRAEAEIGVASTKGFTAQLAMLAQITIDLALLHGGDQTKLSELSAQLERLPQEVEMALDMEPSIKEMAKAIARYRHALFLGRGTHHPVAMEGALKLKEISYIHAESYAAGELKHGPLAMVDDNMPVIAICPNDELLEKLLSNIEEVRARGGRLYVFAGPGCSNKLRQKAEFVIEMEFHGELNSPILFNIPLQLLAYHVAVILGNDVDQPRNLAKSVTVE